MVQQLKRGNKGRFRVRLYRRQDSLEERTRKRGNWSLRESLVKGDKHQRAHIDGVRSNLSFCLGGEERKTGESAF